MTSGVPSPSKVVFFLLRARDDGAAAKEPKAAERGKGSSARRRCRYRGGRSRSAEHRVPPSSISRNCSFPPHTMVSLFLTRLAAGDIATLSQHDEWMIDQPLRVTQEVLGAQTTGRSSTPSRTSRQVCSTSTSPCHQSQANMPQDNKKKKVGPRDDPSTGMKPHRPLIFRHSGAPDGQVW